VGRYWIGGKARKCRVPHEQSDEAEAGTVPTGLDKRLRKVEERLQQLLQASEEDRSTRHGFLLIIGGLAAAACITWIAMTVYRSVWATPEPPESLRSLSVPVEIDGEPVLLGIQTARWKIPPRLQAEFLKQQRREFEEALEKAREEVQEQIDAMKEAAAQNRAAEQNRK
jgi:hypothetical protein